MEMSQSKIYNFLLKSMLFYLEKSHEGIPLQYSPDDTSEKNIIPNKAITSSDSDLVLKEAIDINV